MISVDKALSIYTDNYNRGEAIDLQTFKTQMADEDYIEFQKLISFTHYLTKANSFNRYEKIIKQLHEHKERIYDLPKVANFRTSGGQATKDAKDKIDKIFDEEFKNE